MSASILVVGWDTGSGHLGRCTLRVSTTRAEFVDAETIDVGHVVTLRKPRVFKGGRTQVEERIVNAADLEECAAKVRGYLAVARVGEGKPLCAIERSVKVAPRPRFTAQMATQLKTADWIGGDIAGQARHLEYHVCVHTPGEVRGTLCGNQLATDDMVKAAIELAVSGWPKRSNPHVRDAGAVALYAARRWLSTEAQRVDYAALQAFRERIDRAAREDYPAGPEDFRGSDYP